MKRILPVIFVLFFFAFFTESSALAQSRSGQPGWAPNVIKRGAERAISRKTPIQHRPYRPMHIYGNTVRRIYYRSTPRQRPRIVKASGRASSLR